jgi:hypothetical protein
MGIHNNSLIGASSQGYQISRSLRFRSSASAYLNRTPSSAGNRQKFTISVWYKAGGISSGAVNANIINAGGDGSSLLISGTGAFGATYVDRLLFREAGTTLFYWPMVFRDPSAWYHIVFAMDTTQATASNRAKLYVNGVDQGAFLGTAITQNTSTSINNTSAHYINVFNASSYHSDLYYTEYNLIDGQALTPSSFGETNAVTGVWQPKAYSGTYGTNGFYLNFSDNSNNTAATIGKDNSGNGNNWTPNNISVTAGVTNDSMTDVPTLYADGNNGRGNYCTWSPLGTQIATYTTSITNGNLTASYNAATNVARINGTLGVSSGKWYFEFQSTAGDPMIGFATTDGANAYVYDGNVANKRNYAPITSGSPTSVAYGATWNTTNIIGVALDLDAGTLVFYKDNVSQGTAYSSLSGTFTPIFGFQGGTTVTGVGNFGQRPFSYTPPTGFVALNTQNLPASTIFNGASYMAATTYTGTGSALAVTNTVNNISFQPDFVWTKSRSNAYSNHLEDAVRGVGQRLLSDSTAAEVTGTNGKLTAFNSNGFTQDGGVEVGASAATYVAWQWNAGGSTVTNTAGTISAQVRANPTAGFSVVTYTGTGSAATVGHGLGVAPKMVIVKNRDAADAWQVYHAGNTVNPETDYLVLNTTAATADAAGRWNDTLPTSTVFSIGNGVEVNTSTEKYVAYCFASVAGYSAFGSYTGNGSADGPFVFLGFRPRWVMIKGSSFVSNWFVIDTSRSAYNVSLDALRPNLDGTETSTGTYSIDILSNGFKLRTNAADSNTNAATFIWAAFAENPFKNSLAR